MTIDLVEHRVPASLRDVGYCDVKPSGSVVVCLVSGGRGQDQRREMPLVACVSRPLSEPFLESLNRVLRGDVFEARGVMGSWHDEIHEVTALDIFVHAQNFRESMASRGYVDGDIELSVMARLLHGNDVPTVHAFRDVEFPRGKRVATHLRRAERLGPARAKGVFEVGETSGWILTHKGMLRGIDSGINGSGGANDAFSGEATRQGDCACAIVAGAFDPAVDLQIMRFACARAPAPGPSLPGTARRSRAVLVVTAPSRLVHWQRLLRDRYRVSTVAGETPDMGVASASETDVVLITLQDLRSMSSSANGPETMLPAAVCAALESRVERVSQYSAEVRLPEFYGGVSESIFRASVVRRFRASSGRDTTPYLPAWAVTWPYCVVDLPAVISSGAVPNTIFWDLRLVRCARMRIVSAGVVCVGDDTDTPEWHMRKTGLSRAQELAGYVFGDWTVPLTASVGHATAERTLRVETPPARLGRVSRLPTVRVSSCDPNSIRLVPSRVAILETPLHGLVPDPPEACPICCTGRACDVRLACGHDMCHACLRHVLGMSDEIRSSSSSGRVKCPFCRAVSDPVVHSLVPRARLEEVLHGQALPRIRDMAVAEAHRRRRRRSAMVVLLENESNRVVRGAKKYLRGALASSGVEVVYVRRADRMASRVRRVRIIWEHLDNRKFVVVVAQRKMDLVGVGLPVSLFVVVSGNADPSQLWACTSTPSECVSVRKRLIADITTADAGEAS